MLVELSYDDDPDELELSIVAFDIRMGWRLRGYTNSFPLAIDSVVVVGVVLCSEVSHASTLIITQLFIITRSKTVVYLATREII